MIRVYTLNQAKLSQYKNPSFDDIRVLDNIVWIDLQSPIAEEKEFVEKNYSIEFFTSLELQELKAVRDFLRRMKPLK